jgi:hypothetical protein
MLLLDKLLPMLKSSGHRVLIFSQVGFETVNTLENFVYSYLAIDPVL